MKTKSLDLGCGKVVRNIFNADEYYGIDFEEDLQKNIFKCDLAIEPIPFSDNYFDFVTACDVIEHIPRIIYNPNCRFCFVELMNEIYRILKPNGIFYSHTPAFPHSQAWRDPTHVNIITDETFPFYFCNEMNYATNYGFEGCFEMMEQKWSKNIPWVLETTLMKPNKNLIY